MGPDKLKNLRKYGLTENAIKHYRGLKMTAYAWLEKFLIIQLTHIPRVTHLVPTITLLATKAAPIVWKC